jgi:hypothetical protein
MWVEDTAAGPRPVLRLLAEAGSHGVLEDVPDRIEEVLVGLDLSGSKAPLEEMATPPARIEIRLAAVVVQAAVPALEPLHPLREVRARNRQYQVKMVGHHAKRVDDPVVPTLGQLDQRNEDTRVVGVDVQQQLGEHARGHVIRRIGFVVAERTGHRFDGTNRRGARQGPGGSRHTFGTQGHVRGQTPALGAWAMSSATIEGMEAPGRLELRLERAQRRSGPTRRQVLAIVAVAAIALFAAGIAFQALTNGSEDVSFRGRRYGDPVPLARAQVESDYGPLIRAEGRVADRPVYVPTRGATSHPRVIFLLDRDTRNGTLYGLRQTR